MKPRESAENYLETILMLSLSGNPVRSIDIVNELDYTKPSVSVAMKNLRTDGYITMDNGGYINLTASGRKIAEAIYERHMLISDWLTYLGVDRGTAAKDACMMEHDMSEQSFTAIQKHIKEWKASHNSGIGGSGDFSDNSGSGNNIDNSGGGDNDGNRQ